MNRDQKEATKIVSAVTEVAKTFGLITFGLGRSMTMLTLNPKQAAALLVTAADQIEQISEQVLGIAEDVVKWDESRIITKVKKPLLDAHHNPIK
jgi:hypothetical protein